MQKIIFYILLFGMTGCLKSTLTARYEEFPMVFKSGIPFIKVKINNKDSYFMLDTGCSRSNIDISDSSVYNFHCGNTVGYIKGIGNELHPLYDLDDCDISFFDEIKIKNNFVGMDLNNPFFNDFGIKVSGTIGSDVLSKYNILIDIKNGILFIKK